MLLFYGVFSGIPNFIKRSEIAQVVVGLECFLITYLAFQKAKIIGIKKLSNNRTIMNIQYHFLCSSLIIAHFLQQVSEPQNQKMLAF
jgi:hypothetical protein